MRGACLALIVALASTAGAMAGDEYFGPFSVRSDRPDLISLDGEIGSDSYADFSRARRAAPEATTLVLSSDGGHVDQAMRIARDVRRLGLDTYVPLRHGCYSACAYIYFAGIDRRAKGQLGVHQVSDPAFTAISLQESLADLIDLFNELGVDDHITSQMLRTPPKSLYILDGKEMDLLGANAGAAARLDDLDDLYGHLPGSWDWNDTSGCRTIAGGVGWSGGCVPAEWIPTAPGGSEKYFYQDAEHRMGLLILDNPGDWTRDELRDVVLDAVDDQREDGAADALQEMTWPAAGVTFDLMVYPGRSNGIDVLYQHFYRALPRGGAIQVVLYSSAGQAWLATSRVAKLLNHLELDAAPAELPRAAAPAARDRRTGERSAGDRQDSRQAPRDEGL